MKEKIVDLGSYIVSGVESLGEIFLFLYKSILFTIKPPYNLDLVMEQINEIGIKSIPIVIISSMAIGMVMVVQLAWGFAWFGAKGVVGPVVSLAFVRELGPVVMSLLVGGRVGSGITAEIGSMKVTEQIDALRTLGADPIKKLVSPRLLASTLSFPLLAIIADLSGIFGAMIMAYVDLDVKPKLFFSSTTRSSSSWLSGRLRTWCPMT